MDYGKAALNKVSDLSQSVNEQLANTTKQTLYAGNKRFMTLGKNLFNYATVTTGQFVNYTDGTTSSNSTYNVTDYIAVSPNTQYTLNFKHQLAFYDANKVYISGLNSSYLTTPYTITTPSNCAFIRTNIKPVDMGMFQIELGNTQTPYEIHGYKASQDVSKISLINLLTNSSIVINSLYPPSALSPLLPNVDNKDTLQTLVNYINTNGGGTLFIPQGTYLTNEFFIPPNVIINGSGENVTILKLNNNRNKDFITFDQSSYAGITNLTVDANRLNNITGSGVSVKNSGNSSLDTPRNLNIQQILITNCAEHGFKVDGTTAPVWISQFRFIKIDNCNGYGVYNKGTDNSFYAIDIFNCLGGAMYNSGGNNKIIGGKWYCNGNWNSSANAGTSLYTKGRRNLYVGLDIQDNYGDGITLDGAQFEQFHNVIVDACGITGIINFSKTGLVIKNTSFNITFNGMITDYLYNTRPLQYQGVSIDSTSHDIYIDAQIDATYITTPLNIDSAAQNIFIEGNQKKISGSTSNRPAPRYVGQPFFDTTLGKQIHLKQISPAVWVDATGATV